MPARHHRSAPSPRATALVLSGGGARAAYQVGVLQAIAWLQQRHAGSLSPATPFQIYTGTSAGALNAVALACGADQFALTVGRMARAWRNVHANQVYETHAGAVLRSGARWLGLLTAGWLLTRWMRMHPRALLDNTPLLELLRRMVPLERLPQLFAQGLLSGVAVTASSYAQGDHYTFYQAAQPMRPWTRSRRRAVAQALTHKHLLASAAIPFIFPAQDLTVDGQRSWFGDGSLRQVAPIAPAIHLGADRVLVVGVGRQRDATSGWPQGAEQYPSLAQVAGHALSGIFLDALPMDVERIERINHTLSLMAPAQRAKTHLRPLELLVISPSQPIDVIASRHLRTLPAAMRALMRLLGAPVPMSADGYASQPAAGAALASYLLFESAYTRALMRLGWCDTLAQQQRVCAFFGWSPA